MNVWRYSKYLFQSSPPDMAEAEQSRWTFGVYEILDRRNNPGDPKITHVSYLGSVEVDPDEVPAAEDDGFSAKLEEVIVKKFKALARGSRSD